MATYYVKTGGSDANTGLSDIQAWAHHPWMSTWTGSVVLTAGDTVCMNRGNTWSISSPSASYITVGQSGTVGNPITTTWYGSGAKPILYVVTNTSFPVIAGYGKSYITFDNLEIKHYSSALQLDTLKSGIIFGKDAGLNVPHDWVVTNCVIHNCPCVGIANLDDAYNITIGDITATITATTSLYSNHIYDIGYCGVDLIGRNPATNRSDFNVYYNYIHDIDVPHAYANSYGIAFSSTNVGSGQLQSDGWPQYATARYNYVENVLNWEGIDCHGGNYIYFLDNYVYNCLNGIVAMLTQNLTYYEDGSLDHCIIERNVIEEPITLPSANFIAITTNMGDATHLATNCSIKDNTCFFTTRPTSGAGAIAIVAIAADGIIVEGNIIYNGPTIDSSGGIFIASGDATTPTKNLILRNNWLKDWGPGISFYIVGIGGDIAIYNNIIKSSGRVIDAFSSGDNTLDAGVITVYNNTFISPGTVYMLNFGSTVLSGGTFLIIKNNIIGTTAAASWGYYILTPNYAAGTFTCNYNLYWNCSGPYFYHYSLGARSLTQWKVLGFDANTPNTVESLNPLFANAGGSYLLDTDFQIPTGSPAKNAGVDVDVPSDYFGNYRNVSTPDIGAHEFGATALYDYQYVEYTDGVDTFRDGVRDTYYVIDKELNSFMGFAGTEDVDWENIYLIS